MSALIGDFQGHKNAECEAGGDSGISTHQRNTFRSALVHPAHVDTVNLLHGSEASGEKRNGTAEQWLGATTTEVRLEAVWPERPITLMGCTCSIMDCGGAATLTIFKTEGSCRIRISKLEESSRGQKKNEKVQ